MPPPGILPDPGMGPGSPALQVGSSQPEPQGGGGHGAREELHGEHRGYRPWAPTAAVAESLRPGCRAHWASLVGQTVKTPPAMRGDLGSTPGLGFPGGGHDNPLQYSRLENPIDRGAWWATQSMGSHRVRDD